MGSMRDLWKAISDAPQAIGDLPGKALHAVVDLENQAEQGVLQAGVDLAKEHGVISQATAQTIMHGEQVVQGVREGAADVVSGLAKTAIDPQGTAKDVGKGMADAYTKGGGGVGGVVDAVNVVNPLYHAAVAGYETYQAVEKGDYKAAGRQGLHAAVDVAATAAIAVGGAELLAGDAAAEAAVAEEAAAGRPAIPPPPPETPPVLPAIPKPPRLPTVDPPPPDPVLPSDVPAPQDVLPVPKNPDAPTLPVPKNPDAPTLPVPRNPDAPTLPAPGTSSTIPAPDPTAPTLPADPANPQLPQIPKAPPLPNIPAPPPEGFPVPPPGGTLGPADTVASDVVQGTETVVDQTVADQTVVDQTAVDQTAVDQTTPDPFQDPRPQLARAAQPMTKAEARAYGNEQAAEFREATGMDEGATVQAGHTAAARHVPESGISQADWDQAPMQQLHSRKGQGLDVEVTDQSGGQSVRTRHTAQEGLIDDAVARARDPNTGILEPQGQLDAAEEVRWRTENVPMDQRDVNALRAGLANPEPGPAVDPSTGRVVDSDAAATTAPAPTLQPPPEPDAPPDV